MANVLTNLKQGVRQAWFQFSPLEQLIPASSIYSGFVTGEPRPPYARVQAEVTDRQSMTARADGTRDFIATVQMTLDLWHTDEDKLGETVNLVHERFGNPDWTAPNLLLMASIPGNEKQDQDEKHEGSHTWHAEVPFEVMVAGCEEYRPDLNARGLLNSLASYYKLSDVNDSHGTNHLTNTNGVTFAAGGALSNAATFASASSQSLVKASAAGLSLNAGGTISAWVKRNGLQGVPSVVHIGDDQNYVALLVNVNQACTFASVAGSISNGWALTETGSLTDATWTHYVVTWASVADKVHLFKNGSPDALTAGVTLGLAAAPTVTIGRFYGSNYFNGSVDEVAIVNRAWTHEDVIEAYGSGTPPAYPFY